VWLYWESAATRDLLQVQYESVAWVGDTFQATSGLRPTFATHLWLSGPSDPCRVTVQTEAGAATCTNTYRLQVSFGQSPVCIETRWSVSASLGRLRSEPPPLRRTTAPHRHPPARVVLQPHVSPLPLPQGCHGGCPPLSEKRRPYADRPGFALRVNPNCQRHHHVANLRQDRPHECPHGQKWCVCCIIEWTIAGECHACVDAVDIHPGNLWDVALTPAPTKPPPAKAVRHRWASQDTTPC